MRILYDFHFNPSGQFLPITVRVHENPSSLEIKTRCRQEWKKIKIKKGTRNWRETRKNGNGNESASRRATVKREMQFRTTSQFLIATGSFRNWKRLFYIKYYPVFWPTPTHFEGRAKPGKIDRNGLGIWRTAQSVGMTRLRKSPSRETSKT